MLRQYDNEVHPVGEGLPDSVRVHRVKVVTVFMKAGVPLTKVDCLCDLLEENTYRLSNSQNLRQLIQFIQQQEQIAIIRDLEGKSMSIIFDGTIHVSEAMVVVIRFVGDQRQIKQHVARLMLLAKSPTGEDVSRQLIVYLLHWGLNLPSCLQHCEIVLQ